MESKDKFINYSKDHWIILTTKLYPKDFVDQVVNEFFKKVDETEESNYISSIINNPKSDTSIIAKLSDILKSDLLTKDYIHNLLKPNNSTYNSWFHIEKMCRFLLRMIVYRQDIFLDYKNSLSESEELLLDLWNKYYNFFEVIRTAVEPHKNVKKKFKQGGYNPINPEKIYEDTPYSTCNSINDLSQHKSTILFNNGDKYEMRDFNDEIEFVDYLDNLTYPKGHIYITVSESNIVNETCYYCWRNVIRNRKMQFHPLCLVHQKKYHNKNKDDDDNENIDYERKIVSLRNLRNKYISDTYNFVINGRDINDSLSVFVKNYFKLYPQTSYPLIKEFEDFYEDYGDKNILRFFEDDILRKKTYFKEVSLFIKNRGYRCKNIYDILKALEPNYEDPIYELTDDIKKLWEYYINNLIINPYDIYDKLLHAEVWIRCKKAKPRRTRLRKTA